MPPARDTKAESFSTTTKLTPDGALSLCLLAYAIPAPRFWQSEKICALSTSLPPKRSGAKVPANNVPMNGCSDEFPLGRIQPQTSICPSSCSVAVKPRKAGLFRSRRTERMPSSTAAISEPVRVYAMGDLYRVAAQPTNRTDKAATARVQGLPIAVLTSGPKGRAPSRALEPARLN
jgi:hypothetical protein